MQGSLRSLLSSPADVLVSRVSFCVDFAAVYQVVGACFREKRVFEP